MACMLTIICVLFSSPAFPNVLSRSRCIGTPWSFHPSVSYGACPGSVSPCYALAWKGKGASDLPRLGPMIYQVPENEDRARLSACAKVRRAITPPTSLR